MKIYILCLISFIGIFSYYVMSENEKIIELSDKEQQKSVKSTIDGEWVFVGKNTTKIYSDSFTSKGATLGVISSYTHGYEVSGFNEEGAARELLLSVCVDTSAKGWFQKISAKIDSMPIRLVINPENGEVSIKGFSPRLLSGYGSGWTVGKVKSEFEFDEENFDTFYKITMKFHHSYYDGHFPQSCFLTQYLPIYKKFISSK